MCSAIDTGWIVVTTVVVYTALFVSAFLAWAFKCGEEERRRRAADSQAKYDSPVL